MDMPNPFATRRFATSKDEAQPKLSELEKRLVEVLKQFGGRGVESKTGRLSPKFLQAVNTQVCYQNTTYFSPAQLYDLEPDFRNWVEQKIEYFMKSERATRTPNELVALVRQYQGNKYGKFGWLETRKIQERYFSRLDNDHFQVVVAYEDGTEVIYRSAPTREEARQFYQNGVLEHASS